MNTKRRSGIIAQQRISCFEVCLFDKKLPLLQHNVTIRTGASAAIRPCSSIYIVHPLNLIDTNFAYQGLSMSGTKKHDEKLAKEEKVHHLSRKDAPLKNSDSHNCLKQPKTFEEKENCKLVEKVSTKKMRLFGKYFQVHKKLYIPLPGIFSRNRLYKAQSCGSLIRDKISQNPDVIMRNRQRAASVIRNSIGSESDINQNLGLKQGKDRKAATAVQLNNVCTELTGICATHLGHASKCCSFC
uniref:Uncharacterized protein n=1 Tax=Photinus pyralis TaxID=7054 RepID=A0A1Y1N9C4_PHOPY